MKILIIEDEPRIAANIKKGLEIKGHTADIAFDGTTGYDIALAQEHELIILDRLLPGIDGLTLCKQLRDEKISTPILMLTALSLTDDKVDGLTGGADDYLTKPFEFKELLARIAALARRPNQSQASILQVSNLTLNPATTQVSRANQSINLSHREYALLEYLMRHPGQVFTADQLVEHAWNYEADVTPNAAQVYLGYLRKKIDKAFPHHPPLLHTIRGLGYKLSDSEI